MIKQENEQYIRVRRDVAKRHFNAGTAVFAMPWKMRLGNMWTSPMLADHEEFKSFEEFENSCTYYNCNNETGKYLAWYIVKVIGDREVLVK